MQNLIALTSRELKSFWYSPVAYVVGAIFLLLQGYVFALIITALNDPAADVSISIAQAFFGPTFFYSISILITAPFLTMAASIVMFADTAGDAHSVSSLTTNCAG